MIHLASSRDTQTCLLCVILVHAGNQRSSAGSRLHYNMPSFGRESFAGDRGDPFRSGEDERSAAVVLDSEATSFLMMGALSPGESCCDVLFDTCHVCHDLASLGLLLNHSTLLTPPVRRFETACGHSV